MTFDPSKKHPLYTKRIGQYILQRHSVEGEEAIKAEGTTYLPALSGASGVPGVSSSNYDSYKGRASYMNAVARTTEALAGAILRKKVEPIWPKKHENSLKYVGYCQETWDELKSKVVEEVIGISRYGLLVDSHGDGSPYVATYTAENITNWESGVIGGKRVPIRVHLREVTTVDTVEGVQEVETYRVLLLGVPSAPSPETPGQSVAGLDYHGIDPTEFDDGPIYYQEVWVRKSSAGAGSTSGDEWVYSHTNVPKPAGGGYFREIPFTAFNGTSTSLDPEKPVLHDVSKTCLALYRNSADYEHGLHFTALPQPWAAGFDFKGPVSIGSTTILVSQESGARCGYMEFTGQGLLAIKDAMRDKKKDMAALAAKILETAPEAGGNESSETLKMRHSGENGVLSRIAESASNGLTNTLRHLALFLRIDSEVSQQLNTDFVAAGISPQFMNQCLLAVQAGLMSHDTYYWNLQRGEVTEPGVQFKDEQARIISSKPEGITSDDTEVDPIEDDDE